MGQVKASTLITHGAIFFATQIACAVMIRSSGRASVLTPVNRLLTNGESDNLMDLMMGGSPLPVFLLSIPVISDVVKLTFKKKEGELPAGTEGSIDTVAIAGGTAVSMKCLTHASSLTPFGFFVMNTVGIVVPQVATWMVQSEKVTKCLQWLSGTSEEKYLEESQQ